MDIRFANHAIRRLLVVAVLFLPGLAAAEDYAFALTFTQPAAPGNETVDFSRPQFNFDLSGMHAAGLQKKVISSELRVRGWQLNGSTYFGQARVGDEWGLGLIVERGDTAFGVNHRGIQIMKKF
ncbi:MAG: hypothetical protein KDI36_08710 [Pseudomonadales bacterium]|nr:hypothetical protein [Pseudomonadales bacterium]